MKPAFSVIFLTVLIGAAQGLVFALFSLQAYSMAGALPFAGSAIHAAGSALALSLMGLGLLASFFHLGRPERAWRAAAMWRTSWLSREVIALPAAMGLAFLHGLSWVFGWESPVFGWLGPHQLPFLLAALAALAAFALFVCTGMIYAAIRFIQEWATPLTVINFLLMGSASGFLLAGALAASLPEKSFLGGAPLPIHESFLSGWGLALLAASLIGRLAAFRRNALLKPKSTIQSAIGTRHPKLRQVSMGLMGGSFNTREFFHGASQAAMRNSVAAAVLFGFAAPIALAGSYLLGAGLWALWAAALVQMAGLLAERWVFFAQANHPQNLYYQRVG